MLRGWSFPRMLSAPWFAGSLPCPSSPVPQREGGGSSESGWTVGFDTLKKKTKQISRWQALDFDCGRRTRSGAVRPRRRVLRRRSMHLVIQDLWKADLHMCPPLVEDSGRRDRPGGCSEGTADVTAEAAGSPASRECAGFLQQNLLLIFLFWP